MNCTQFMWIGYTANLITLQNVTHSLKYNSSAAKYKITQSSLIECAKCNQVAAKSSKVPTI